jgi:hypothetical protein
MVPPLPDYPERIVTFILGIVKSSRLKPLLEALG